MKLLQETGYNAIRSAHNPCSKALLDACDRLGMLVMDEYIDHWYIHKVIFVIIIIFGTVSSLFLSMDGCIIQFVPDDNC